MHSAQPRMSPLDPIKSVTDEHQHPTTLAPAAEEPLPALLGRAMLVHMALALDDTTFWEIWKIGMPFQSLQFLKLSGGPGAKIDKWKKKLESPFKFSNFSNYPEPRGKILEIWEIWAPSQIIQFSKFAGIWKYKNLTHLEKLNEEIKFSYFPNLSNFPIVAGFPNWRS